MRAIGLIPNRSATDWRVITSAAAPSEIDEALAAVIVPSLAKAGLSVGILAASTLAGCSSSAIVVMPLRVATSTGAISRSNAPDFCAFCARSRLAIAKDRKNGVEGKSVSVRVDLGGRRSLQKKKQKNQSKE